MALPPGFRFCPTNEELVTSYLLKKVNGEELPWNGIAETEVYGDKAPWQIFGHLDDQEEEKVYVFTKLKKASKNRVARTAGSGTWHESCGEKIYQNRTERVIGIKKLFCFKAKEGNSVKKTNWLMHEYSLFGEQEKITDLVLCAIYKKAEKRIGIKRNFEDQIFISQEPATITSVQTLPVETPESWMNTDMLLLKDGTRQGKRMRCDVEYGPEAFETASECLPQCNLVGSTTEYTRSESIIDSEEDMEVSNMQIFGLETHTCGYLPTNEDEEASISDFHASYGYLPLQTSPKSENCELDQWIVSIFDDELF